MRPTGSTPGPKSLSTTVCAEHDDLGAGLDVGVAEERALARLSRRGSSKYSGVVPMTRGGPVGVVR